MVVATKLGPGVFFGSYRLVRQHEAGRRVDLWRAHHLLIDRFVAMEILPLARSPSPELGERFEREARVLSRLNHPNVLAVNSFGVQEGHAYLTRPLVDGLTLDHLLGEPWPLAEALLVLEPLASALDYLHARGLVHRGISAGSVLIADNEHILLLGLGIDWLLGSGTLGQSALERADDDRAGLGRIAFELLTGRPPFEREVWPSELQPRSDGPMSPPCALSATLPVVVVEALFRAVAAEPAQRHRTAMELIHALRSALPAPREPLSAGVNGHVAGSAPAVRARPKVPAALVAAGIQVPEWLALRLRVSRRTVAGLAALLLVAVLTQVLLLRPARALLGGRGEHAAVLLAGGEVLLVGGCGNAPPEGSLAAILRALRLVGGRNPAPGRLDSSLLYVPGDGTWRGTGRLARARCAPHALSLPNGRVLVVGGSSGDNEPVSTAERYDRPANAWSAAGQLWIARRDFAATELASGQILVVGGAPLAAGEPPLPSSERYDLGGNRWSLASSMNQGRRLHTVSLLPDGRVLAVGGLGVGDTALAGVERWDPNTNVWLRTEPLHQARASHTAILLANGQILVAGGLAGRTTLATAERYDPGTDTWLRTAALSQARTAHTATLLPDGRVLVVGGTGPGGELAAVERYDPAANAWSPAASLPRPRAGHTATLLPDGRVLVTGGRTDGDPPYLPTADLYNPATDRWTSADDLPF